mmetsp:Transcript_5494/g.12115  ORF Transcript_5494/g.12115 Transcript_5494/m.12115 type:complete len:166 (+) Transcript_5494:56-553(+)
MAELDATVCDAESLEAMITGGDSYTATQLYVGQIRRLQAADDYLEAEAFGARGVSALVAEGEVANATNIALKVVESMATRKAAIDEKAYARLIGMVEAYGVTGCPAPPAQVRTQSWPCSGPRASSQRARRPSRPPTRASWPPMASSPPPRASSPRRTRRLSTRCY